MGGVTPNPVVLESGLLDQTAATVMVYGILAALVSRSRSGRGQRVSGSIFGSAIHFQHGAVNYALWKEDHNLSLPHGEGSPLQPKVNRDDAANPLYNWYRCSDGRWLMFCEPAPDRFWAEFCHAIGASHLAEDTRYATAPGRDVNRAELIKTLDAIFAARSLEQWLRQLKDAGLSMACSPVNAMEELSEDVQAKENGYIAEVDHRAKGRIKTAGIPLRFSGTPVTIPSMAPLLGEHTEQVLSEVASLNPRELSELRAKGVIA